MSSPEERRLLIEAYRSGQISEDRWDEHLRDDDDLFAEWAAQEIARSRQPVTPARIGDDRHCTATCGHVCAAVAIVLVAAMLGLAAVLGLTGAWRP